MNVQERELQEKIDPFLTTENLTSISRTAFGASTLATGYRVLTGGCWNRVIAVTTNAGSLVIKISPTIGDTSLAREYAVLKVFAERTEMPVATPYLVDLEGSIIPGSLLVESLVPGEVMHHVFSSLDVGHRRRIGDEIADYLAALHTIRDTGFGGIELDKAERHSDWPDFWIPRFTQVFNKVEAGDFISEKMLEEIGEAAARFPAMLALGETGTLTHYDIWSGNVMIDIESSPPKVSGFIDIPGYFADYAREISFMHVFGMADDAFFSRYTRTHTLDPGFPLRLNIYSLRTHLQHITMYPRESYYRQGALECLRYIQDNGS